MRAIYSTLLALILTGCTGLGQLPFENKTVTTLDRANFRVIRANARGEDVGFYLFGFWFLPLRAPSITAAVDSLQSGANIEGRAVALVNVTQERREGYFVLFSMAWIIVRADVIEFLPEPSPNRP